MRPPERDEKYTHKEGEMFAACCCTRFLLNFIYLYKREKQRGRENLGKPCGVYICCGKSLVLEEVTLLLSILFAYNIIKKLV